MATPDPTPPRGRRRQEGRAKMPRIITFVATLTALVILAGIIGVYAVLKGDSVGAQPGATTPTPQKVVTTTPSRTPSPTRTVDSDDLVERARKIKPLEDISKGDRVLYQGYVCTWQSWDRNLNTSNIRCPDGVVFATQTGRLTPVELKKGTPKD